jgi:glycosyltransferase involved in cell wall biosynthesis
MRIGIYLGPAAVDAPPGGAAYSAAVLAEHLEQNHHVHLLHHRPNFTRELLNSVFSLQLNRTLLNYCEPLEPMSKRGTYGPWKRYSAADRSRAERSDKYDAFVAFVHRTPPFCHAQTGVLVILFPLVDRRSRLNAKSWPRAALLRRYDAFKRQRRLASYQHRFAISQFAAEWTRKRWTIECGVLYPPVDLVSTAPKEDLILSVSRFTPIKRQYEMVGAFRQLSASLSPAWAFTCAGGVGSSPESVAYFAQTKEAAAGASVYFYCNIARHELNRLFGRAKIFWHSMGYLEDADRFPERLEHFGIVTVEAMSAGCVPVVFDGGGQAELVRHGVDGFRWRTIDELKEYTRRLADDDQLRLAMAHSAAKRAAEFSKSSFLASITNLIGRQG